MSDQEKVKARIQQEIANKVSTKLLDELKEKDYQLRVVKAKLLKIKIEKIMYNNNLASMSTKDTHFREMCLFSNNQLNQVINLLNIIMKE